METVVLVIHLLLAVSLVGVILIQRSEGGGLGIGGSGGMGGMMTARSTANLLTRTTAILAGSFMLTSMVLAIMAGKHNTPTSLIQAIPVEQPAAPPANAPAPAAPVEPATPAAPSAPVAQ